MVSKNKLVFNTKFFIPFSTFINYVYILNWGTDYIYMFGTDLFTVLLWPFVRIHKLPSIQNTKLIITTLHDL